MPHFYGIFASIGSINVVATNVLSFGAFVPCPGGFHAPMTPECKIIRAGVALHGLQWQTTTVKAPNGSTSNENTFAEPQTLFWGNCPRRW